jgi:hypothetical protein
MMGILLSGLGATYTSKGMIFTVVKFTYDEEGWATAHCLLLSDHPKFTNFIKPGTVMEVEHWTSVWEEAMQIASPGEQGKVLT